MQKLGRNYEVKVQGESPHLNNLTLFLKQKYFPNKIIPPYMHKPGDSVHNHQCKTIPNITETNPLSQVSNPL
jgi:hypothetical protein